MAALSATSIALSTVSFNLSLSLLLHSAPSLTVRQALDEGPRGVELFREGQQARAAASGGSFCDGHCFFFFESKRRKQSTSKKRKETQKLVVDDRPSSEQKLNIEKKKKP